MQRQIPLTAKVFMIALALVTDIVQLLVGLIPIIGNAVNIIIVDSMAYFIFGVWFLCYRVNVTSSKYWKIFFGGGVVELIAGFIPVIGGFIPAWTITIILMNSAVEGGLVGKAVSIAASPKSAAGALAGAKNAVRAEATAVQGAKTAAETAKARESAARKAKTAQNAKQGPRDYESSPYYNAPYFNESRQWDQSAQNIPRKAEPARRPAQDAERPETANEGALTDDYGRPVAGKDLEKPYERGDGAVVDIGERRRQKRNPAFEDPEGRSEENEPEDWDLAA